jgi:16S rRNA (cytosine967-C5)-methyltransferase
MIEVQRIATLVVGRVLTGRSLDAELRAVWAGHHELQPQDRAALQDISFGTLRFLGQIDAVLDALLARPLKDERVRMLLRVALYQLIHTRAAAHAVVDHAVRTCAVLRETAAKGLVNGVLRSFLRRREELLRHAASTDVGRYSHPQWWIDKLRAQDPQHHADILDYANRHPPMVLRVNRRRMSAEDYASRLHNEGIESRVLGAHAVLLERPVPVERLPGFHDGDVSVQDASAQYAALALDLHNGMRVLDACAAPGGKSAHMLECADIDLTALDNDEERLARVAATFARLKLCGSVMCGDAAAPGEWWDGEPYARILADVPCSASGVVRRHPDIKWLRRPGDIDRYAARQSEILGALWQVLATGGKLLYATCSVFEEEGSLQIARFLERHQDAQRLILPAPHTNPQVLAGQILPDEHHDGFFYALLQKA